ncbi:MAG: hypothetical protein EXR99_16900 [Gemmataceae bacterium]|nr:hypothetical protein [Gemmataceae bacterium]
MTRPLSDMPVLILAGGLGTRLRAAVSNRPKALAPIGNRPFLEIQMELLRDQGARHFVLCVGHLSAQILQTFGNGERLGVRIDYSEEKEQLRGTAGALKLAERFFQQRALVLNGDTYLDWDHNELLEKHLEYAGEGALATCAVARLPDGARFGSVDFDPSGRFLQGFREKNQELQGPAWLNAGAYVLEKSLLNWVAPDRMVSLEREIFPVLINQGEKIGVVRSSQPFYDIGTPEDLDRFRIMHRSRLHDRHRVA